MRRFGLIIGIMLIIFAFTGTALAGSVGIRISRGAGIHHTSRGHRQFVNHHNRSHRNQYAVKSHRPSHKYHRFAKNRHLSHGSHVFYGYRYPSGSYRGRDYSYENGEGEQGIYPVISSDQKMDNSDSQKEVKEPLPPHIETFGKEGKATLSSNKRIPAGNTGAHIVVYNPDKN